MSDRVDDTTVPALAAGPNGEQQQLELGEYERWLGTLDEHLRVLERERQKFSAIVNHGDAAFLMFDPDASVTWANARFRQGFQLNQSERRNPRGLSCNQVLCRKSSICRDCPVIELFLGGAVNHREMNIVAAGRFQHVYTTAIPVRGSDGKLEHALVMIQDLSDLQVLQRSEQALRTNEQRFRSIFEQSGAGMVTLRADGSFIQVNPAFCRMLGYTESDLIRMRLLDVTDANDASLVRAGLEGANEGQRRVLELESRYVRRDGTAVWCYNTIVWQFDAERRPTHAVALVQDISERKKAELALEQSQRRYEALVHSIDGIVWESEPRASRFTFVSKQAERVLGYPVERWLSQPRFWRNQIHPDDLERVSHALAEAVNARRAYETEYRMISSDGRTVWVRDSVNPVVENERVGKLRGLMVDITERKKAEEALRQSEEQLRQSQKMEAIGRLAGGIAHDFNNLLTAITGYGDFLKRKLGPGHPLRREADEITKAAERAADLTGQLLAFSRQQVLQPKVLDLEKVVADMEKMLRRLIGEHIQLATRFSAHGSAARADPGQVHQVLLNLAVNARDAMPDGGCLTIEVADVDLAEPDSGAHPGLAPGAWVMLAVSDTGCGMDVETRLRLFEPFFTTKEQGKGTGLGLSTVYGIVKQSGGHISVDSSVGRGSLFRIYLPRVEGSAVDEPAGHEAQPEMATGSETILLVEDDGSVRDLAREVLEMNGYTVIEAADGVEALAVFGSRIQEIDLMVTDLVMPRLGGRDLARQVARQEPTLPVLFLSGYTDSAVLQQGGLDGSFFLRKPFTPATLAHKVREVLDSRHSTDGDRRQI